MAAKLGVDCFSPFSGPEIETESEMPPEPEEGRLTGVAPPPMEEGELMDGESKCRRCRGKCQAFVAKVKLGLASGGVRIGSLIQTVLGSCLRLG